MIAQLSKRLASFFVFRKIIEKEDEEVYEYGLQLLLSTVANGLIALLIAIITGTLLQCFFYLVAFVIMRKNAGGYHANTHIGCCCILVVVLSCFIAFMKFVPTDVYIIIAVFSIAFSMIIIFLFSPLEHKNKPISSEDKIRLKRKSRIYILIISVIIIALGMLNFKTSMISVALGICTSSGSIAAAKILKNEK